MRQVIRITLDEGQEQRVIANLADHVAFERQFNTSATSLIEEVRTEHWAFLAFTAMSRQGLFAKDFDDFLAAVTDLRIGEEAPKVRSERTAKRAS